MLNLLERDDKAEGLFLFLKLKIDFIHTVYSDCISLPPAHPRSSPPTPNPHPFFLLLENEQAS